MMNHKTSAYLPGLIWTLVRTDFKTRYHGTLGGYLWALAKPLTMFAVLYGVFSVIFTMDTFYALNLIVEVVSVRFLFGSHQNRGFVFHAKAFC